MLMGIPSILGPELLFTLRAMGHGDEIALVDGNYPAQEHARRLIRADGHGLCRVRCFERPSAAIRHCLIRCMRKSSPPAHAARRNSK